MHSTAMYTVVHFDNFWQVLNSLDAEATCIAVRLDLGIFKIQVVDNGNGIQERDLQYLGTR